HLPVLLSPETHAAASRAYCAAAGDRARRADRGVAVWERTASDAVRLLGLDPARVRVVHEAAAPVFTPRHREDVLALGDRLGLNLQSSGPYILFVGTLQPRKNVPLLLEAFGL